LINVMAHEVPPLPYDYSALEPYIDTQTMQLHHDKHHAAYVNNLNAALEKHTELANKPVEQILRNINTVPEDIRTVVRNNGGGHVNHTMFWTIMQPSGGGNPNGDIADLIQGSFGGFDNFKTKFNETGTKQFGSGWVWLVRAGNGEFKILSTANQDSPLINGEYPIFGNDVWEHAYYLKYQNRRPEYLAAWWNVINWNAVNQRLKESSRTARAA
jgi:superoxide dismutase, Fe-Mn family